MSGKPIISLASGVPCGLTFLAGTLIMGMAAALSKLISIYLFLWGKGG